MKKIIFSIIAFVLTFSATAQTKDTVTGNQNRKRNGLQKRQFKVEENRNNLNLSDAQKAQIKSINESFKQQMEDLRKQSNITIDQQKQKREALIADHKAELTAVLTPEQKQQAETFSKDFGAGRGRAQGARFEDLTKDLNLTQDQSTKMAAINSTFKIKLQEVKNNASLSQDEKRELMKNLMKQRKSDIEALLSQDQKEQLKNRQKKHTNRTAVK
jgi:hypothetical protein